MAGPERTIVFDLYGVLARHQDPSGQRVVEDLLGVGDDRTRLWQAYWDRRPAYDRGDVDAATWWAGVAGDLGRSVPAALVERLVEADVASWSRFDEAMVAFVQDLLGDGRELALLSNAPVEIAEHVRARQPWLDGFAAVVFSCEAHAAKPEPGAFAAVEAALGRRPDELLLVDDRAENVEGARGRGWAGLVFTGRPGVEDALGATAPGRDGRSR